MMIGSFIPTIHSPVLQVESDVVVPVETASPRRLESTAAFRVAQAQHLKAHLVPLPEGRVAQPSAGEGVAAVVTPLPDEFDLSDPEALLASLDAIDRWVWSGSICVEWLGFRSPP